MRDRVRQQRAASFQGNAEFQELRNSGKIVAHGTGGRDGTGEIEGSTRGPLGIHVHLMPSNV